MSEIISPTPGRIVWFYAGEHDGLARLNGQPLAAIIAGVHDDRHVNLAVFDSYGNHTARTSVTLVQPGDEAPNHAYASWMPYQVKTAGIELPVVDAPAPASDTPKTSDTAGDGDVVDAEVTKSAIDPQNVGGQQATEKAQ